MDMSNYVKMYMDEVIKITQSIDQEQVNKMIAILSNLRDSGGEFFSWVLVEVLVIVTMLLMIFVKLLA